MVSPDSYRADLPESEAQLFELSSFPTLDTDEALKMIPNNEFLVKMLKLAIEQSFPSDFALMIAAHDQGDWDKTQKMAHKIKGGAGFTGLMKMYMACQYLERYWKIGERDLLEKLYQQALDTYKETKQCIEDWLERNDGKSPD